MKAVSLDLRERIIKAREDGLTQTQIAERLYVGRTTVQKILRQWRDTGSLEPAPRPGRPRGVDADGEQRLRAELAERPDATLQELRDHCGLDCSTTSVFRALGRMRQTRKKRSSSPPNGTVPISSKNGAIGRGRPGGLGPGVWYGWTKWQSPRN